MKGKKKTSRFKKTTACPSSPTLLSYRIGKLSSEMATLVGYHLKGCEFCNAELALLAHHERQSKAVRTPEIPINLRILAESILSSSGKTSTG
jgi:hypothetical protein